LGWIGNKYRRPHLFPPLFSIINILLYFNHRSNQSFLLKWYFEILQALLTFVPIPSLWVDLARSSRSGNLRFPSKTFLAIYWLTALRHPPLLCLWTLTTTIIIIAATVHCILFYLYFFFGGTGVGTQELILPRQFLSHPTSPIHCILLTRSSAKLFYMDHVI
jgi:hypothetical protein